MKSAFLRRLISISVLILLLGVAAWVVVSLRNDDSILSIIIKDVPRVLGRAPDSTSVDVLRRMEKYEKQGRYDDAIKAGVVWTENHPKSGDNDLVFRRIALLYLARARTDSGHADGYVDEAIIYRDKAIPPALDTSLGWYSMAGLRDLALISESAGDLSVRQRCAQYGNAIKLLERLGVLLREKRVQAAGQTSSTVDSFTVDAVDQLQRQVDATITRVRDKLQNDSCN